MSTGRRPYQIAFAPSAVKELARLPVKIRRRVVPRIEVLSEDPRPHGCEKLRGREDQYRIRIGVFRVVYAIEDKRLLVLVLRLADRKDVYGP